MPAYICERGSAPGAVPLWPCRAVLEELRNEGAEVPESLRGKQLEVATVRPPGAECAVSAHTEKWTVHAPAASRQAEFDVYLTTRASRPYPCSCCHLLGPHGPTLPVADCPACRPSVFMPLQRTGAEAAEVRVAAAWKAKQGDAAHMARVAHPGERI